MVLKILDTDHHEAELMLLAPMGYMHIEMRRLIAQAIAVERERCAQIAEGLRGWGVKRERSPTLANHIAKVIRSGH